MITIRAYMVLGLVLLMFILTGCSTTVPVVAKFPNAPASMGKCDELTQLNTDAKLSDVALTVSTNYSIYYECSVKNDAWIEWYQKQKSIFESVK
jgi:hypothetical protein